MKFKHERALETLKVFPYIAWGLTVVFAFFVYNITRELQAVTHDLQRQTEELRVQVGTPVHEITNFERSPKNKDSQ